MEETRQRLRAKLLQRQLQRGPGARPGPERRRALLELAQFQAEGRQKLAIQQLVRLLLFASFCLVFGVGFFAAAESGCSPSVLFFVVFWCLFFFFCGWGVWVV